MAAFFAFVLAYDKNARIRQFFAFFELVSSNSSLHLPQDISVAHSRRFS